MILLRLLSEGLRLAVFGAVGGMVAAVLLEPCPGQSALWRKAADPVTIGGSVAILLFTAVFASGIPALRVLRYAPAKILRD